jgi:hypothetical protein
MDLGRDAELSVGFERSFLGRIWTRVRDFLSEPLIRF